MLLEKFNFNLSDVFAVLISGQKSSLSCTYVRKKSPRDRSGNDVFHVIKPRAVCLHFVVKNMISRNSFSSCGLELCLDTLSKGTLQPYVLFCEIF